MRKLLVKLFVLGVLALVPLSLPTQKVAAAMCCSACVQWVEEDPSRCYQLVQIAKEACWIDWIQDPCEVSPTSLCYVGCPEVCDDGC